MSRRLAILVVALLACFGCEARIQTGQAPVAAEAQSPWTSDGWEKQTWHHKLLNTTDEVDQFLTAAHPLTTADMKIVATGGVYIVWYRNR